MSARVNALKKIRRQMSKERKRAVDLIAAELLLLPFKERLKLALRIATKGKL